MRQESGSRPPSDALLQLLGRPLFQAAEAAQIGISMSVLEDGVPRRIYVSDLAARILGYPADELVGMPTFINFKQQEAARLNDLFLRSQKGEAVPQLVESVVVGKDGKETPVEVAFSQVPLDGAPATVAFFRDITERRRTEDALKRSERLFRELIEAAPEAVVVSVGDSVVYGNPRYLQLLKYDRVEELFKHRVPDFVHPDDRAQLAERRTLITASAPGTVEPLEYRLLCRDRTAISVECSSLSIVFEGAPAILTFIRDVTQRKKAQAQLIQTDRMATIGTLSAAVAHELNNPLAYVMLNLGLLERDIDELLPNPEHKKRLCERLGVLQEGAAHMASVVQDLRAFCRPDSPAGPVDLRQVLESAVNMGMSELRESARLVRDYAPVREVLGDGARLGQVFLNLLLNAVQSFPERDSGANEIRVVLRNQGPDQVRVEISDTGTGIAPDVLDLIFEPFFTTKAAGVGTGLGLSICKSLVSGMNGELIVDSEVGRGSTFIVVLPATG